MALVPILTEEWVNSYPCLAPDWSDFEQSSLDVNVGLNVLNATEASGRASATSNISTAKSFLSGPGAGTAVAHGLTELTRLAGTTYSSSVLLQFLLGLSRIASTETTSSIWIDQHVDLNKSHTLYDYGTVSATATVSLEDISNIFISTGIENLFSVDVAKVLTASYYVNAAALSSVELTDQHLMTQSAAAEAFATAYHMFVNHELTISRSSLLVLGLALAAASGINASAKIEIDLTSDILAMFGIEETANISTGINVAIAQSVGITLLAQALAEAGLDLNCLQSIVAGKSVIAIVVKLPDGRHVKIAADVRTRNI